MKKTFPNGVTLKWSNLQDMEPKYVRTLYQFNQELAVSDFLEGKPVPKGVEIEYQGKTYHSGRRMSKKAAPTAPEEATPENNAQAVGNATESAPTLDMFDNTDPNAPRTSDQNNAFWGLMDKLGKLTGRTGEEMKTVVVARALGENKGTSKLTIGEMHRVIEFVKQTIELFESHRIANDRGGEEA